MLPHSWAELQEISGTLPPNWLQTIRQCPPNWADILHVDQWPTLLTRLPPNWLETLMSEQPLAQSAIDGLPSDWEEQLRAYQALLAELPSDWRTALASASTEPAGDDWSALLSTLPIDFPPSKAAPGGRPGTPSDNAWLTVRHDSHAMDAP